MLLKDVILSMRPRQWVKNFFIFLPPLFGRLLFKYPENAKTLLAFILFSLSAGAIYLINDVIDVGKDRLHPTKRNRPLADGKIKKQMAVIIAATILTFSILLAFLLDTYFGYTVVTYLVFNILYSTYFKNFVILDVFCIGVFFVLRLLAGTFASGLGYLSHWIIIMTALLSLFLGFTKRRQELKQLSNTAVLHRSVLAKYSPYYIDQMIAVTTSSIVIAYMLYTVDSRTVRYFGSDHLLYSIPFVYYGIFRYLYLIYKRRQEGEAVQILHSDRKLQIDIVLWFAMCVAVVYFGL